MARRGPRSTVVCAGLAVAAAVLVAEAAVLALRPRAVVDPVAVPAARYFSADQLRRAEDFRGGQRLLGWGALGLQGATLVLVASGRSRRRIQTLGQRSDRPVVAGAATGAAIVLALAVVDLPLGYWGFDRARDVGLVTQDAASWAADQLKSTALGLLAGAAGGAAVVGLQRRFGGRWWGPGAAVVVLVAIVFTWLAPVVLTPLFNRLEPLPAGPVRQDVEALARRADVKVGQVYRIDASRRSRALNAYVDGIGPTKRVVLYDTTLDGLGRQALDSVVAHELAHQSQHDIPRGLLWLAIVAPVGVLAVRELGRAIGGREGTAAGLPAVALALWLVAFGLTTVSNQLSRSVEARADTVALELTDDPDGLVELQRRLAITSVADPTPPTVPQWIFGTHPTTMQRIGAAEAWRGGARP